MNRHFFAYIECLIAWNDFKSADIYILLSGHTHEAINQAFSQTSERLRSSDAVTIHSLHTTLRVTHGGAAGVAILKSTGNWSGLCNRERSLQKVPAFSHLRHLSFTAKQIDE